MACMLMDIPFLSVTIAPDPADEALGVISHGFSQAFMNLDRREFRKEIRDHLVSVRCGPLAETTFTGQYNEEGARGDDELVSTTLWQLYGERAGRHEADLTRQARRLVAANWRAIQLVAAALLDRQTLTSDEVTTLCNNAS